MGELHGWVELGTVSTDSAAFVIVDPAYAGLLHDAWLDHLDRIRTLDEIPPDDQWAYNVFHELHLTPGPDHHGETALWLSTDCDGGYRVLGRFENHPWAEGRVALAEVRIILNDDEPP